MSERLNRYFRSGAESYSGVPEYERDEITEKYPEETLFTALAEHNGLKELSKNKLEKTIGNAVIAATRSVLEDLRLGNIGRSIEIDDNSIHIISEAEAEVIDPDSYADGWHDASGVYVLRTSDRVQFARVLSHELGHYVSYQRGSFRYGNDWAGLPEIERHNSGLASFEEGERSFYGIMEATTELFASEVRKKFCDKEVLFNLQEKNILNEERSYVAHVRLLKRIMQDVASTNEEYEEVRRELLKDHIVGTANFLDRLKYKLPEVYVLLRDMGTDPGEVVIIAQKLGYVEIAEEVQNEFDVIERAEEKDSNKMVQDLVDRFKAEFPDDYQLLKTGDFKQNFKLAWDKKKDRWAIRQIKKMGYNVPDTVSKYDFLRLRHGIEAALQEE